MLNNTIRELTPAEKESTMSTTALSMYEPSPTIQQAQESIPNDSTEEEEKAAAEGAVEIEYASGFKLVAVVAALALSVFLVSLDMTIVATAIPKITDVSVHIHQQEPQVLMIF